MRSPYHLCVPAINSGARRDGRCWAQLGKQILLKVNRPVTSSFRVGELRKERYQSDSRFLAWFILKAWRWRRHVPSKRRLTSNGLHGVISQKVEFFITTAVRTSNYAKKNCWTRCFLWGPCRIKYSVRSERKVEKFLPRTSCLYFWGTCIVKVHI
jgi:hypothetical protein